MPGAGAGCCVATASLEPWVAAACAVGGYAGAAVVVGVDGDIMVGS
jgi:hypothetical protein